MLLNSTTDFHLLHESSTTPAEELSSDKFDLIAPCLQHGVSISQRARETGVHRTTIYRLVKRFRKDGNTALTRKKRKDKGITEVGAELAEIITAHLVALPHLSYSTVQRLVGRICAKKEWPVPSYWNIYRISKNIPPDLLTLSKDSAEYRRLYELVHRFEANSPNEIWQADHNFMDIFVWDDFGQAMKPILTVVLDDYSRAVAGYYLDFAPPSAQRTALALRQAIWHKQESNWLICGIPERLYTDRGADFTSKRLQTISAELEFELIKGRPYYPQGKGKIERFFESMNQLFLCELTGYTAEDKPPQRPGLTIEELRRAFHKWLIDEYMHRENEDIGDTPFNRWTKSLATPRTPESIDKLHMLLMTISDERLVRRDGIHTLGLRYLNTELQFGYIRERVVVRYDPSDVSQIFVFHENTFVCNAVCADIGDIKPSYQDIQKARSLRKKELHLTISTAQALVKSYSKESARPIPEAKEPETKAPEPPKKTPVLIRRYSVDE